MKGENGLPMYKDLAGNWVELPGYESEEEALKVRRGTDEWYLYHSYKNEEMLPKAIIGSFVFFFLKNNGWLGSILIWLFYFYFCEQNNRALDNDPLTLKRREAKKQYKLSLVKKKKGDL